ncbi:hypothetical protein SHIRM173S_11655 [Streptomyces hirsutus]
MRQDSAGDVAEREIPEEYLEGYAQILEEVAATGRRLSRDELVSRRNLGNGPRRRASDCAPWYAPT